MLALLIAKHCIFHAFDANLANVSLIFMSKPSRCVFFRNRRKKDKNQANWMRNEENVQIVVIVATTTIHGHDYDSKLREDWWWTRLSVVVTIVETMTHCLQYQCSIVTTIAIHSHDYETLLQSCFQYQCSVVATT